MASLQPFPYTTGTTLKAVLRDLSTGAERLWNTSGTPAFEAYTVGNIANYGITAAPAGSPGYYTVTVPSTLAASAAGNPYVLTAYKLAGSSLAVGDLANPVWQWVFYWDGSKVVDLGPSQAFNNTVPTSIAGGSIQVQGAVTIQVTGGTNGNTLTNQALYTTVNYPYTFTWTYAGMDSTGWTQFNFTAKSKKSDADSASVIAVQLTNPGAGSDGLTLLNGAVVSSPTLATDGTLTITLLSNADGTKTTVVTLALLSRGTAVTAESAFWEISRYSGGESTKYLVDGGPIFFEQTLRQNPVAS